MKIFKNKKGWLVASAVIILVLMSLWLIGKSQSQPDVTFVVVGDSRSDILNSPPPALLTSFVSEINILKPDFVIHLGDMVFSDATDEIAIQQQYENFLSIFNKINSPKYYVCGNHDVWNVTSKKVYEKTFGSSYYSFTQKGYLFIVLDTVSEDDKYLSDQLAWLEPLLQNSDQYRNVFLFSHCPIIQKPELYAHPVDMSHNLRTSLMEMVEKYNIRTVFASHLHLYDRSIYKNFTQYISGGGGAPLLPDGFHHILAVTLKGDNIDVQVYKPGEITQRLYKEESDRLYEYSIRVPKNWRKDIISESLKLSHVIYESPDGGHSVTIKCWKRDKFITPKMLISQLAAPYQKSGLIESHGYVNVNGNKGYECAIRQEVSKLKYAAFVKRDNIYLLESVVNDSNTGKSDEFARILNTLLINCDPYPKTFRDETIGFIYKVPDDWEFTTISAGSESIRLMINKILNGNENLEKQPQVFLDVRENHPVRSSKEILRASLSEFQSLQIPYHVLTEGQAKNGNLQGYFNLSDLSDEGMFFQRKMTCYSVGKYFYRFIIDSHNRDDDPNRMAQIVERGLSFR